MRVCGWVLGSGFWILGSEFLILNFEFRSGFCYTTDRKTNKQTDRQTDRKREYLAHLNYVFIHFSFLPYSHIQGERMNLLLSFLYFWWILGKGKGKGKRGMGKEKREKRRLFSLSDDYWKFSWTIATDE